MTPMTTLSRSSWLEGSQRDTKVVIVLPRGTLGGTFGGAQVQAVKTAKFLNKMGVTTDLAEADASASYLNGYDVVHIFDHTDTLLVSRLVKKVQKKLVFTPLYWQLEKEPSIIRKLQTYFASGNSQFFLNQLRRPYSMSFYLVWRAFPDFATPIKNLFGQMWLYPFRVADAIIVTTVAEERLLQNIFGREFTSKIRIVHNGVDDEVYGKPITHRVRDLFSKEYGISDYVLSVGRLEPKKNQLRLVQACCKLDIPCVLIGRQYDSHYSRKVLDMLKQSKIEHRHVEFLKSDSDMLVSAYLNARVVALVSTHEISPLVTLEAGSLGRTVLVTKTGGAIEYLKDLAYYVNPESQQDVVAKLEEAWDNPFNDTRVREYVLKNFTWSKAAERLSQIYQEITVKEK